MFLGVEARIRDRANVAIQQRWGEAFDALELHWLLCRSLGLRHDWEWTSTTQRDSPSRIALHQLFWTAHHTAAEVLTLLRSGYPAGAIARWRALCELDVRCSLLARGGDEADGVDADVESWLRRTSTTTVRALTTLCSDFNLLPDEVAKRRSPETSCEA